MALSLRAGRGLLWEQTGDDFLSTLLNHLVTRYRGSSLPYSKFLEYFDSDPKRFFPS